VRSERLSPVIVRRSGADARSAVSEQGWKDFLHADGVEEGGSS
jgi:hypothetical protein